MPNIIQMNSNFVATDPKGELLSKLGKVLEKNGYEVIVLDLKNHEKSHGYNPFRYFRRENDVLLFVNNMWESMSDKTAQKGEQIWDDQAKNMLMSIVLYLYTFAPQDEQNFDMVLEIMSLIDSSEEQNGSGIPKRHEMLFEAVPHDSTAYKYYKMWNAAKGRTLSSIVATLSAKMAVFSLESMRKLTYHDEMDILKLATGKVAVIQQGNWAYGEINKIDEATAKNLTLLPMPIGGDNQDAAMVSILSQYWTVNSKASDAEKTAAKDFLNWLYQSDEGKDIIVNSFGFIPVFDNYGDLTPSDPLSKAVVDLSSSGKVVNAVFKGTPDGWGQNVFGAAVQAYISGEKTWDEVVKTAQDGWAEAKK